MIPLALACTAPAQPGPATDDSETRQLRGFEAHLLEAIAINEERALLYGEATSLASVELSERLIASEKLVLPVAADFDERARPFVDQGIPVMVGDFVSMEHIAAWDTPPQLDRGWSRELREDLDETLEPLLDLDPKDFETTCSASYEALQELRALERAHGAHLAMTRHVVESVGFAALHAQDYSELSDGETEALSADLVKTQLQPLRWGLARGLDREAAELHGLGVGVLVNDVPYIPFEEEFAQR